MSKKAVALKVVAPVNNTNVLGEILSLQKQMAGVVIALANRTVKEDDAPGDEDDQDERDQEQAVEDDRDIDDPALDDARTRARKVYFLSGGALNRTNRIPERPSACRRVFKYLKANEAGTVKQMAHALMLDKKTVGNAISALNIAKLLTIVDLPRP